MGIHYKVYTGTPQVAYMREILLQMFFVFYLFKCEYVTHHETDSIKSSLFSTQPPTRVLKYED